MKLLNFHKVTDKRWINLFHIEVLRKKKKIVWEYVSRSKSPLATVDKPDAVVICCVYTDEDGFKSLSYDKLTAVLIEAFKEQHAKVEELKTEHEEEVKQLKADNEEQKTVINELMVRISALEAALQP